MFKKLFAGRFQRKNGTPVSALVADALQAARECQQAGDFQQAESLYRQVLQHEPGNATALHSLGMLFFQAGQLESSAELVSRAIDVSPEDSTLHFDLGFVSARMGDLEAAARHYRKAIALQPNYIGAHYNLGIVFDRLGRVDDAIACYRQIITLAPDLADAYNSLGLALEKQGRFEEAAKNYDAAIELQANNFDAHANLGRVCAAQNDIQGAIENLRLALKLNPDHADVNNNLGCLLAEQGEFEKALPYFQHFTELCPDNAQGHFNLGNAFFRQKEYGQAIENCQRALELEADHVGANNILGCSLLGQGELEQAIACFQRFIALSPDNAEGYLNLGKAFYQQNSLSQAIENFRAALKSDPDHPEANYSLGGVFANQGKFDQALPYFRRFTELAPDNADGYANLGKSFFYLHQLRPAIENFQKGLSIRPDDPATESLLFLSQFTACEWSAYTETCQELSHRIKQGALDWAPFWALDTSFSAAEQKLCAENFAKRFPMQTPLWTGECYQHDRIRIAYVSGDFGNHPVCFLMAGVFEQHDRERFELFAISLKTKDDDYGLRAKNAFDHFIDVSEQSEREIATLIRSLEIDIVIDLMGWTSGHKLGAFAYRPAPVHVSYLGYPGTIGSIFMDYILADSYVIPPESQTFYTEKVVYLPDCFQANDDKRKISPHRPARSEVGLPESGFVFCSFSHSHKFSPDFFDIWMRLLKAVPDSVLWLLSEYEEVKNNLSNEAKKHGIDSERLIFAEGMPYTQHLSRFQLADLFLDTLPFNAGATASDALWSGVPVLTCSGEAFASRMAGSLLHAVGLPELIAGDLEKYEALALKLASGPKQLTEIKARLMNGKHDSPLFNTRRFTRHLESAYSMMWERHQRGEVPASFKVPSSLDEEA